ncbi:nuclear transport factor 2 family protein [Burkholderia gladioli]|uniref:nuclear transport factor 2 family protein n=1 Tax=Burkholderia gladioli TaxID=28095 RepID=UPI00163DF937|nr:nuclear transport factor 2 family protein [Burkholderia gladioli]
MSTATSTPQQIAHIHRQWHKSIVERDIDGLMSLYAEHARFESPTILFVEPGNQTGILDGREAIRGFFSEGFRKLSGAFAHWYRTDVFHTDGKQLIWEYPRDTPSGDQTDLVEVMDIEHGLIVHHRVYWGWRGLQSLLKTVEATRRQP